MSEHDEQVSPDEHAPAHPAAEEPADVPTTGVAAVDEVLAAVARLEGRPVEEHVAVFEQAHERLRRALDPGHG
ncbi:hypothetical protein [Nocardioides currus]|uniref:Uncharacterized protein n=1 Tax=Nocardioides currus TaxID=2133958 RepID=A0A2R7YTP6_9ACTN|nr:hypothetical protein [Nocardioides currus]PUA79219.1 hypothetical protein C7S10_19485 [Nocardioides currus]